MRKLDELARDGRLILKEIESEILEVANCYNEVCYSDLQGIASATARRIIDVVLKNQKELK